MLEKLIRYKKIIILGLVIFLILFFVVLQSKKEPSPSSQATPLPSNSLGMFNEIQPNKTTESQVKEKLGKPSNEIVSGKNKELLYTSHLGNYPNEVILEDGKVSLTKEQVVSSDGKTYIIDHYLPNPSSEPTVKYIKENGTSSAVFIFPQDGYAFIASVQDKMVFEVWRFAPNSIQKILETWGVDLVNKEEAEEGEHY